MSASQIRLVEDGERDVYPISADDRLDSHFFLQWNLKRWRGSEFRKKADPEVGWYGLQLFFIAQDGTPIGTLPCDDQQLAFDLNLPLERWMSLKARDVSPLHGWYQVPCDNGEVRWAHPVVTEIAFEAINSKRRNKAKNADDRMRKRIGTIATTLKENIPGGKHIASSEERINGISDWIEQAYPGGSATTKRIKEALDELSSRA